MRYRKNAKTERPIEECPANCAACSFFAAEDYGERLSDTCLGNGLKSHTTAICDPRDRPMPLPLNCPWWYASAVWDKLGPMKRGAYHEMRFHQFICHLMQQELAPDECHAFTKHFFRLGGGLLIDFETYPEALKYAMRYYDYPEFAAGFAPGSRIYELLGNSIIKDTNLRWHEGEVRDYIEGKVKIETGTPWQIVEAYQVTVFPLAGHTDGVSFSVSSNRMRKKPTKIAHEINLGIVRAQRQMREDSEAHRPLKDRKAGA